MSSQLIMSIFLNFMYFVTKYVYLILHNKSNITNANQSSETVYIKCFLATLHFLLSEENFLAGPKENSCMFSAHASEKKG